MQRLRLTLVRYRLEAGAVMCGALALAACNSSPDQTVAKASIDKPKAAVTPEQNCTSREAFEVIRDQVFDGAIAKVQENERSKLNSLRSIVAGRLETPAVIAHDEALKRTECTGRIVIGLPPNTKKAFEGATQLTADIQFSVQPAADRSGLIVATTGTESLVDNLVAGAQRKRIVKVSGGAGPNLTFENVFDPPPEKPKPDLREFGDPLSEPQPDARALARPSFGCTGKLSSVEKMVCTDPGLAEQDRTMAEAYRDAKDRTPPAARTKLEGIRLKYLARRNSCSDQACVSATYDAWTANLYEWNP